MRCCSPERTGILGWYVFLSLLFYKQFPTSKPLCLLSLCLLIACAIADLVSITGDRSPGFGGCFMNGIRHLKGDDRSVSCSALAKQLHEVLLALLRQLYFAVSWCRWVVEAEPYLVIPVILIYFTLYWIYYPLPPALFPDFFSSLELIICLSCICSAF